MMNLFSVKFVFIYLFLGVTRSLPLNEFYPYGEHMGDKRVPNKDEGSTDEVKLRTAFLFYQETYFSYFINVNGIISFLTEIPYFFNAQFPLEYPVIAPFYSDIDTSVIGNIWYRETSNPETVQKAITDLRNNFAGASQFRPSSVSIITYDSVGPYEGRRDKVNTFQVVLVTDATDSYIIFNYADGGLQWLQGDGKTSGLPDALGQAGFIAKHGRMLYTLRGSGTDQVRNLDKWSNVDQPGVWMFRVGEIAPGKNIQLPDLGQELPVRLEYYDNAVESCVTGGSSCHSTGSCIDYEEGFCCRCNEDSYGNGVNCVRKDAPIRVTGKLSGNINGIDIIDADLHSYVLATEGRTYTAVSNVPKELGYDLQSLTGIGEGIAWMFAIPMEGVSNGFTMTGGDFNRSVEVSFPQSGHKVDLLQNFQGLDVFNNVAVITTISGSLPTIPIGSELEVGAFKEEITRVKPGHLRSRSNRVFKLKGQTIETPYSVETLISFEECDHAPVSPETETLRFKVAENIFIRFDEPESIVRFSFSAKIGNLEEVNPCIKGKEECGDHSQCIVDGDHFRCVCEQGFDYFYDSSTTSTICLDMNECSLSSVLCDANAICLNNEGSYSCQCNQGYVGDGHYCRAEFTCYNAGCDMNAACEEANGQPQCTCNVGYSGDGFFCSPDFGHESCHITQNCSPYAMCAPQGNDFVCRCLEGYLGDGYSCEQSHYEFPDMVDIPLQPYYPFEEDLDNIIRDRQPAMVSPNCNNQNGVEYCSCPQSYTLSHKTSMCELVILVSPYDNYGPDQINPPQPVCSSKGNCICPEGFTYNDLFIQCDSYLEAQSCSVFNNCHTDGQCLYYGDRREYRCTCNAGFTGNGQYCFPLEISCDQVSVCHYNADCIYDDSQLKSICVCKEGYSGDGLWCNPKDDCSRTEDCHVNAQCQFDDNGERYICVCNDGYDGNGFYCEMPNESAERSCNFLNNCHFDADCLLTSDGQFVCVCRALFVGDGYRCETEQMFGCEILNNCGSNAFCGYHEVDRSYKCSCIEGYEGDGFHCEQTINCLLDRSLCHEYATCERTSVQEFSASCICQSGFAGDGFDCKPISACLLDRSICHQHATCERNPYDELNANCVCRSGYEGNGFDCQVFLTCLQDPSICPAYSTCERSPIDEYSAVCVCRSGYRYNPGDHSCDRTPDDEKNLLLVNQGLSVLRMPIDNEINKGYPIVVDPYMTAVGADIDCLTGRYYWTDFGSRSIRSSKYDGTERMPVISGKLGSPEDVAVDWISKIIYWTDSINDVVSVSDIQGNKIRTIIKDGLVNPRGIAVHPGLGFLFWSDWDRENPKIEMSGMDGTQRKNLVTGIDIRLPNSLVIDYETTSLCWADAGTHKIECIGVDGYGRRVVIEGAKYPFGLTLHQRTFYYTDWNDTKIHEVNKYSGVEEDVRLPPPGGSGKLYGIVAVPDQCPPISNVCQVGNGRCKDTYLCLPNGRGGRTCACSDEAENQLDKCVDYDY